MPSEHLCPNCGKMTEYSHYAATPERVEWICPSPAKQSRLTRRIWGNVIKEQNARTS